MINTVAYNDVDSCENELSEQKKAIILNIGLVERLAFVCRDINAKLVHFSTNYVFSGEKEYYCEEDITSPINFYGLTKCLGEEAVLYAIDSGLKATIIRVSNLFGPQGVGESSKPSFFDSILKVAKTRDVLNIVNDERCCFTYTKDIAVFLDKILERSDWRKIYHCVNSQPMTWYEAAKLYFSLISLPIEVRPINGCEFNRNARRPKSAVLYNNSDIAIREFKKTLLEYINDYN